MMMNMVIMPMCVPMQAVCVCCLFLLLGLCLLASDHVDDRNRPQNGNDQVGDGEDDIQVVLDKGPGDRDVHFQKKSKILIRRVVLIPITVHRPS